ncbi:hypothetical protein TrST_g4643 [Triparma strigata]|uniref:Cyclin N-terminal domain-containing protein n=1 Tax=Triparma strigata TaxID=1606541 RepID=A0A9W7EY64_9STRA|nr:hypothetical protein TrST_g4643 [Triparma strigata]
MKMRLRSKKSDRAVLGDVSNKRSASDAPITKGSSSTSNSQPAKKQKTTSSSSSSSSSPSSNPLLKQPATSTSTTATTSSSVNSQLPTQHSMQGSSSLLSLPPPPQQKKSSKSKHTSTSSSSTPPSAPSDPSSNEIIPEAHTLQYADAIHSDDVLALDKRDLRDPLLVANYATDLYQGFFRAQDKCCPTPYMDTQADINSKMRAILIDWLIEVHMKFKLVPETLYLCVNIIDRYCQSKTVPRAKLQLVGVTALLIACKYEEIYPPEVRDCVYITDNAYTRQEVLDMEQDMLWTLQFHITVPTAYPFLVRYLSIIRAGSLIKIASNYYTERTLQEHDMLKFPPSLVSCASVFLAFNNGEINDVDEDSMGYPEALKEYSGYSMKQVQECAALIAKKVGEEPVTASRRQLVAVKKKYASDKYRNISENYSNPSTDFDSEEA